MLTGLSSEDERCVAVIISQVWINVVHISEQLQYRHETARCRVAQTSLQHAHIIITFLLHNSTFLVFMATKIELYSAVLNVVVPFNPLTRISLCSRPAEHIFAEASRL